jgi:adenylate cyclase
MEALCSSLDCSVILSESVASVSPVPVRSLGRHRLRGIAAERELFTFAPAGTSDPKVGSTFGI